MPETLRRGNPAQRQLFSVELRNRFEALATVSDDFNTEGRERQSADASVNNRWANIVKTCHDACTTMLAFRQNTKKQWFSDNT